MPSGAARRKVCVLPTQCICVFCLILTINTKYVISCFSRDVDGICFLFGHHAAHSDNSQRHFGTTFRSHFQRLKSPNTTSRYIPEQRRSQREKLPHILTDMRFLMSSRSTTLELLTFQAAFSPETSRNTQRCNVAFQKPDIHTSNRLFLVMGTDKGCWFKRGGKLRYYIKVR